jgi:hypothetical protein
VCCRAILCASWRLAGVSPGLCFTRFADLERKLSSEANINPQNSIVNITAEKNELSSGRATGLVECLDSGDAIKSPWTGRLTASDCRREMAIEAQTYERLGVFSLIDTVQAVGLCQPCLGAGINAQRQFQGIRPETRPGDIAITETTAAPEVRYRISDMGGMTTHKENLFALGSTIYFIVTGHKLYEELTDGDHVKKLYEDGVFPNLNNEPFVEIIAMY